MFRVRAHTPAAIIPIYLLLTACGSQGTAEPEPEPMTSVSSSTTSIGSSTTPENSSTASQLTSVSPLNPSSDGTVNPETSVSPTHEPDVSTGSTSPSTSVSESIDSDTEGTSTTPNETHDTGGQGSSDTGEDSDTTTTPTATGSGSDTSSTSDTDETMDPPGDGTGFYINGGKLYDVNGVEFIMRGVNYPYAWFKDNAQQHFSDMSSVGANVVRVVLATGDQWTRTSASEVSNIISWAKANKLIAMLEVHDATGYGDNSAAHPNVGLDYWTSDDISRVIKGQEAYVLINIANEPFGNDRSQEWEAFHEAGVGELRAAGIHHTLIVDAPFWAQDWGNCMRDGSTSNPRQMTCNARAIFDADPDANTMFAVHMYDVYGTSTIVTDYFTKFMAHGLPFLVGEFASDHGSSNGQLNEVDEATIMRLCEERKVGYIAWSWSGNSSGGSTDLSSLDITRNFNIGNLTPWGNTLINGPNGLKETGVPCTCFD